MTRLRGASTPLLCGLAAAIAMTVLAPPSSAIAAALAGSAHVVRGAALRAAGAAGEVHVVVNCPAAINLSIDVDVRQALPSARIVQAVGGINPRCTAGRNEFTVAFAPYADRLVPGSAATVLTVGCSTATSCPLEVAQEQVVYLSADRNFDRPVASDRTGTFRAAIAGRGHRERSGRYVDVGLRVNCPRTRVASAILSLYQIQPDGRSSNTVFNPSALCDGSPHSFVARVRLEPSRPGSAFVDIEWEGCEHHACLDVKVFRQIVVA